MLPSSPSRLKRLIAIGCVVIGVFFGQQTLDKVLAIFNTVAIETMPQA